MTTGIELLFLGTGTSAGVPMIGCRCAVCTSTDPKDKRTRPSVVVSYGNTRVLVDSSPEMRLQCVNNGVEAIDAIVFTHSHADHIMGLDDTRRFNLVRNNAPLDVWATTETYERLMQSFGYAFAPIDQDMKVSRPYLIPKVIEGPFDIAGMPWIPIPLIHGDANVLGFRIGPLAYCTDVSHIPKSSLSMLKGLDVLVLDALQYKKHPTHLTVDEAVEMAQRLGAKSTYFTHMAHGVSHAAGNAKLPGNIQFAYDGQRVQIGISK